MVDSKFCPCHQSRFLAHPQVLEYIEDNMPAESAAAFGLHPNAEIGFKLREAAVFCSNLQALQVCTGDHTRFLWNVHVCVELITEQQ